MGGGLFPPWTDPPERSNSAAYLDERFAVVGFAGAKIEAGKSARSAMPRIYPGGPKAAVKFSCCCNFKTRVKRLEFLQRRAQFLEETVLPAPKLDVCRDDLAVPAPYPKALARLAFELRRRGS